MSDQWLLALQEIDLLERQLERQTLVAQQKSSSMQAAERQMRHAEEAKAAVAQQIAAAEHENLALKEWVAQLMAVGQNANLLVCCLLAQCLSLSEHYAFVLSLAEQKTIRDADACTMPEELGYAVAEISQYSNLSLYRLHY